MEQMGQKGCQDTFFRQWVEHVTNTVFPRVAHVITEAVLCTFPEPQPPPLKALALWFVCKLRLFRIQDPLLFTKKPLTALQRRLTAVLPAQHIAPTTDASLRLPDWVY